MYERLIKRLREYPDREETAGGYVEIDWQDLLDAADAIELLTDQLAAIQAENAEKDKEIERLTDYEEHYRQLTDMGLETSRKLLDKIARVEAERDDIQDTLDMYGGEEGITAAFKAAAERDAALKDLSGQCWCCKNAKPWIGDLVTCDKLAENGVIVRGGRTSCPDWEWRGAQEEEEA